MKRFEFAGTYLKQYEDTDIIISDESEFDSGVVFDLSDGTHWFADNNDICQVSESLVGLEIGYNDIYGYVIINDDGTERKIGWCD